MIPDPLSTKQIAQLSKLRGYPIKLCPICGSEVGPIRSVKDVRALTAIDGELAHKACAREFQTTANAELERIARFGRVGR